MLICLACRRQDGESDGLTHSGKDKTMAIDFRRDALPALRAPGDQDYEREVQAASEERSRALAAAVDYAPLTPEEREDASLLRLNRTRMARIAKGSGTSEQDVRDLLTQFEKVENMFSQFKKNRGFRKRMEKMMKGANIDVSKLGG